MTKLVVDTLIFDFQDDVSASKFDEWRFYTQHFRAIMPGRKAVDVIAFDGGTLYLIEVKDYRQHPRSKTQEICEEITLKVIDTLAALVPAKINGRAADEQVAAQQALTRARLKIVFHLELGSRSGTLFVRTLNPANLQIKLRQLLRPIDPHLQVVNKEQCGSLPWSVE